MGTPGRWKVLLAPEARRDLDERQLDSLLPAGSAPGEFVRTICRGPLLGRPVEVRTGAHGARLLGPDRTSMALTWFALLRWARPLGDEVLAHAVTTAAAAQVAGHRDSADDLTVGLAAAVNLRIQVPTPEDVRVASDVLGPLAEHRRELVERAVFGRSTSEQAAALARQLGLSGQLRALVAPPPGSALGLLGRRALELTESPGRLWPRLQLHSRQLARDLDLRVTVPWYGLAPDELLESDVSPIGLALRQQGRVFGEPAPRRGGFVG